MSEREVETAASPFELTVPARAALAGTTGLILLGLVLLSVETTNMTPPLLPGHPGDAFFPRLVLGFSLIFAGLVMVRALLSRDATALGYDSPSVSVHWLEFASVVVLVLLYAELFEPVGFEITTLVFMMVLLVPRLRVQATPTQAVLQGLALSVSAVLVLYASFALFLKIPLPLKFLPLYLQ
jgi:hypothetical protein